MEDLNEMLSKLLEDPQSMEQLKAAARAMGIDPDGPPPPGFGPEHEGPDPLARGSQSPMPDLSALAALLGAQNTRQQTPPPPAIDPAALRLLEGVMLRLNQPDKNVDLLRALKPHFSPQRGARVDNAIRLLQLFSLLPILRESGILGDLSGLGDLLGGRRP